MELPASTSAEEVRAVAAGQRLYQVQAERTLANPPRAKRKKAPNPLKVLDVVADRFRMGNVERARAMEAIELALLRGHGLMQVYAPALT